MWYSVIGCMVTLSLSLCAAPLAAHAQQPTHVYRIGLLHPFSSPPPSASDALAEALRQGLHDLGYVEGQHFVMESRWAEDHYERLPDLAAELVRLKVDIIVAAATPASAAAKNATETIPIVEGQRTSRRIPCDHAAA